MSDFDPAFDFLKPHEWRDDATGDYHVDPNDPGGETKYGISKRAHPTVDIETLTFEGAKHLYYIYYWSIPGIYQLRDQDLANKVFDLCVNAGTSQGIKILQEALGYCGLPVEVDGRLGDNTASVANQCDPGRLLTVLKFAAERYYNEIMVEHPALRRYRSDWLARAYDGPGVNPQLEGVNT